MIWPEVAGWLVQHCVIGHLRWWQDWGHLQARQYGMLVVFVSVPVPENGVVVEPHPADKGPQRIQIVVLVLLRQLRAGEGCPRALSLHCGLARLRPFES